MTLANMPRHGNRIVFTAILILGLVLARGVAARVPVETFGAAPGIQNVSLSPDGTRVAYLMNRDGKAIMLVSALGKTGAKAKGVDISKIKARSVSWANDRFVLLRASKTLNTNLFKANKVEFGAIFSYDTKTGKMVQLLTHAKGLGLNSSLASIDRILPDENAVMMPAYTGKFKGERVRVLFRVDLRTGDGKIVARGHYLDTDYFIVDGTGKVIARVDFAPKKGVFTIKVLKNNIFQTLYTEENDLVPMSVPGLSKDGKSLIVSSYQDRDTRGLYTMSLTDGSISGPLLWRKGADLVATLTEPGTGVVLGAVFAGIAGPDYQFLDPGMAQTWASIKKALGGAMVRLVNWSRDRKKWLLYIEGGSTAGAYMLFDANSGQFSTVAILRPDIKPADIADVVTIAYRSKDGTRISALLTLPPGYKKHPAPLVVLPHGGPAAHDSLGWDWLAQAIANQGYLVLQPNFRGSDGFGSKFENAGNGQWNGAVLDDITAGVKGLIKAGYADPKRVCIAGASFGGYAALAGLVFTPDLYSCAAAIAPVTDARAFVNFEAKAYGKNSESVTYWTKVMKGNNATTDLDSISPAKHADAAKAPLLLIHGRDDTVVPITQSWSMARAMRRANKPVQLVELKGEDHWLSSVDTRTQTLRALIAFLHEHLDAPAQSAQAPVAQRGGGQ